MTKLLDQHRQLLKSKDTELSQHQASAQKMRAKYERLFNKFADSKMVCNNLRQDLQDKNDLLKQC